MTRLDFLIYRQITAKDPLRSVPIERKAYLKDPSEIEIVAQGLIL